MSSQTNDIINSAALVRLNDRFGSLKPTDVLSSNESEIASIIKPVGFYKTKETIWNNFYGFSQIYHHKLWFTDIILNRSKAKNIIRVAQICIDKYDGDIPDNIDDLVSLPGIGPKMGYLALQCAWQKNEGIGIDTHVHRICQRLNWTHMVRKMTPALPFDPMRI